MGLILGFDLDQTLIDTHSLLRPDHSWIADPMHMSEEIRCALNYKLIDEVIIPALQVRNKGVDAIFLLTNNSDDRFVFYVCVEIVKYLLKAGLRDDIISNSYRNEYFIDSRDPSKPPKLIYARPNYSGGTNLMFDDIMTRNDTERDSIDPNRKSMRNIETMILNIKKRFVHKNISTHNLLSRTYFFDDNTGHVIKNELDASVEGGKYYLIQSNVRGKQGFNRILGTGTIMCKEEHTDKTDYSLIHSKLDELKGGWGDSHRQKELIEAAVEASRKRNQEARAKIEELREKMEAQEKANADARRRLEVSRDTIKASTTGTAGTAAKRPNPWLAQRNNTNALTEMLSQQRLTPPKLDLKSGSKWLPPKYISSSLPPRGARLLLPYKPRGGRTVYKYRHKKTIKRSRRGKRKTRRN